MPLISYDCANLLSASIGPEHGVSPRELSRLVGAGDGFSGSLKREWKAGKLGFLEMPDAAASLEAVAAFAASRRGAFETLLVLGIGGSSLGTAAAHEALRSYTRRISEPQLRIIDNPDPSAVLRQMSGLEPRKTLTLAVSKSGGTLETLAALALVDQWYEKAACERKRHIAAVTGPSGGALNQYAAKHGLSRFVVPENVGGRFSVLSPVGLLPAALLGLDVAAMLEGARAERDASLAASGEGNLPMLAAACHAHLSLSRGKSVSVLMPYASRLDWFGHWYVQLWAESLGKAKTVAGQTVHRGQTAITTVGPEAQHSQLQLFLEGPNDKIVTMIRLGRFETEVELPPGFDYAGYGIGYLKGRDFADIIHAQLDGTEAALVKMQRPNARMSIEGLGAAELGALFMFFQLQTAYAALFLDVDAYDQPAVEIGKKITRERLAKMG